MSSWCVLDYCPLDSYLDSKQCDWVGIDDAHHAAVPSRAGSGPHGAQTFQVRTSMRRHDVGCRMRSRWHLGTRCPKPCRPRQLWLRKPSGERCLKLCSDCLHVYQCMAQTTCPETETHSIVWHDPEELMTCCALACSSFGLKVIPPKPLIGALPKLFDSKQGPVRDAAKSITVCDLHA